MNGCLACDLSSGRRPLPGGLIHRTGHWLVEHCTGPLGLGTLIVKPVRHLTTVALLTDSEAAELGPLLRDATVIADQLVNADQVYNCLWSHPSGVPAHIHYVVQPVTRQQMRELRAFGPKLQVAMFTTGTPSDPWDVERCADRARMLFRTLPVGKGR